MKFTLPTLWIHGKGLVAKTGELLAEKQVKHTLVVTDRVLVEAGLLQPICSSLEQTGITYTVCDKVQTEPTVAFFDALVKDLDLASFDAFVAVGGGSVIDTTKGLRVVAGRGGSIRDFASMGKVPSRIDEPLIAIPTTSGTGSEISNGAVFSDEEHKTKFAVVGLANCPTIALTDPEMTKSMPSFVTAMTGIDALVHAIESYVSRHANLVTEMFALRAIGLIGNNLERAVEHGDNIDVREAMQLGSTLAMASASKIGEAHRAYRIVHTAA